MRRTSALLVLFALAALILGLGIQSPTGLTGKDEYLLGLRIPLEMMQDHRWWVPFIDGAPRLKKPPFIYWMARASYEAFGPSLFAARAVTVTFALLLLGCTAWIGKRLTGSRSIGLLAAGILLGMSGMASESRRLMLDVPVAALSTAALCCYLQWLRPQGFMPGRRLYWLIASALCLTAALMTKGPAALVVFGAGWATLFCVGETRRRMFDKLPWHFVLAALALALPVCWYLYVRQHYGAELAAAAQDELEARQFLVASVDPLIGIVTLALPWSFIALHGLWQRRRAGEVRLLAAWLLLTLLPFFFIRSFDRYLIGSLVPLSLITAIHIYNGRGVMADWPRRLGSVPPALVVLALGVLLWRFERGGWSWLILPAGYFLWAWWRPTCNATHLAASAALLWCAGWGLAFPALGVNAVPAQVTALSQEHPIVMFGGPQPALLPIIVKKPLHQTSRLTVADVTPGTLLAAREEDFPALEAQLAMLGIHARPALQYEALASAGSGVRFARQAATRDDWQRAWQRRSLAPLMSTVRIVEVAP